MRGHRSDRARQRGVSLLFALLAIMALSLAAVGLVRSVDTSSLVVGNIGFKLDATASGDRGAEMAIAWLQANAAGATLDANAVASGYYATSLDALDATGRRAGGAGRAVVDWAADNCATVSGTYSACLDPSATATVGTNRVSWLITRLCAATGSKDDAANSCATSLASGTADDANSGDLNYGAPKGLGVTSVFPYFRIVVRTVGARNTVSFTETIVHF